MFNTIQRRAYAPLSHATLPPGLLYLGCEYEEDAVDFKVFVCQPNAPLFVDLAMTGWQHTKVGNAALATGMHVSSCR
jgi:hypothetical protein